MDEYDQLSDDQIIALANSQGYGAAPQEMFTPSGATPGAALLASMSPGMGNATSLTGGALGLLDMLTLNQFTGIADNLVAGPNAGIDYLGDLFTGQISPRNFLTGEGRKDYYGERVKQANLMRDVFNERRSTSPVGGLLTALEYTAPMPGKKADAFYDTARALKDAGLGLAAFGGAELGEKVAPDSQVTSLLGALLAPAVAAGAYTGAGKTLASLRGLDAEAIANRASAEIVDAAGKQGLDNLLFAQKTGVGLTSALGGKVTAAEIAGSPSLAAYQAQIGTDLAQGPQILSIGDERAIRQRAVLSALGVPPAPGALSEGMTSAIALEQAAKQAKEISVLERLGLTADSAITPQDAGNLSRKYIEGLATTAKGETKKLWDIVPEDAKVPMKGALDESIENYNDYAVLTRDAFSSDTKGLVAYMKAAVKEAKGTIDSPDGGKFQPSDANAGGVITIKELQGLRRRAGELMVKAKKAGDGTEALFLSDLRDNVTRSIKEGAAVMLPGQTGLNELLDAIAGTKAYKDKFRSGVIGKTTDTIANQPKILGSDLLGALRAKPEYITEINDKFGRSSPPSKEIRVSLLGALEAAPNPGKHLTKNIDTYRAAFGSDLPAIGSYVGSRGKKISLAQFANPTDAKIEKEVFKSAKAANAFIDKFKGTEMEQLARGRFIAKLHSSDPAAVKKFGMDKTVAKALFREDFSILEKVMADMEGSISSNRLAAKSSMGQSITGQRLTAMGWILDKRRDLVRTQRTSAAIGAWSGRAVGLAAGSFLGAGGWERAGMGVLVGGPMGRKAGQFIADIATKNINEIQASVAEMLANPKLIRLAAAPPTKKNLEEFANAVTKLGILGARSQREDRAQLPALAPQDDLDSLSNNEMLDSLSDDEIEKLAASQGYQAPIETPTPTPTATPTKRNMTMLGDISIVSKAEAEDKPTSNEMARLEKASEGFNVAKAIAGSSKMVQAVSRVESNQKHASISSRGAIGIMQLMPTTAEMLGVDPYDPKQNIKGGEKYLEQLRDRFKNDKLTFAAYNMGPNALRIAIREAGTRDWERIVKKLGVKSDSNPKGIPAQTIAYVPKVMKFYRR